MQWPKEKRQKDKQYNAIMDEGKETKRQTIQCNNGRRKRDKKKTIQCNGRRKRDKKTNNTMQ